MMQGHKFEDSDSLSIYHDMSFQSSYGLALISCSSHFFDFENKESSCLGSKRDNLVGNNGDESRMQPICSTVLPSKGKYTK